MVNSRRQGPFVTCMTMLDARPKRARGVPAKFELSGWLMPPMRLDRVTGFFHRTIGIDLGVCGGPVKFTFKTGGRIVAERRVRVPRTCMLKSSITIRSRRRLGPRGRLRATARFEGNDLLGPVEHWVVLSVA